MIFYISIAIILLFLVYVDNYYITYNTNFKSHKISISIVVAVSILFIVAALRDADVGADTSQYCKHFLNIMNMNFHEILCYNGIWGNDTGLETVYKFYNKLLSYMSHNRQIITISNSFFQIFFLYIMVKRLSPAPALSIYLYVTLGFYQTALNLTPSSVASYICMCAFVYIKENKVIHYLIVVFLASLIHTSAIAFIPVYFLAKIKWTFKRLIIVVAACGLIAVFQPYVISKLEFFIPDKYFSYYLSGRTSNEFAAMQIVVYMTQFISIAICFFAVSKRQIKEKFIQENNLSILMLILVTVFYILNYTARAFSRAAFLYSPYCIITIPLLISYIDSPRKKAYLRAEIIIITLIFFILRLKFNNIGTTMPYVFFWNGTLTDSQLY